MNTAAQIAIGFMCVLLAIVIAMVIILLVIRHQRNQLRRLHQSQSPDVQPGREQDVAEDAGFADVREDETTVRYSHINMLSNAFPLSEANDTRNSNDLYGSEHDERLENRPTTHDQRLENGTRTHAERLENSPTTHDQRLENGTRTHAERLENRPTTHDQRLENGNRTHAERLENGTRTHAERLENRTRTHDERLENRTRTHFKGVENRSRTHNERPLNTSRTHGEGLEIGDRRQDRGVVNDAVLNDNRTRDLPPEHMDRPVHNANNTDNNSRPRRARNKGATEETQSRVPPTSSRPAMAPPPGDRLKSNNNETRHMNSAYENTSQQSNNQPVNMSTSSLV